MPDKTVRGRFVWHELMTPSIAQAHHFYGKVAGWKTQAFEHDPSYQMFVASSGGLGGTVERAEAPASWLSFIGTTDIETTVGDALQLGATVVTNVTSIPGGAGQWAVLQDPQGATFALYQADAPHAPEKAPKRGEFSWHELATTDYKSAFEFYSKLFGWQGAGEVDMGPLGTYFMFGRNGTPIGGMFIKPADMTADPSWCGYIRVKDLSKAVSKAKAAGATLINGPTEVPGGDWVAQLLDPQGAMFALHTLKADLAPTEPAAATSAPEQASLDFSVPPQKAQPATTAAKPQSVLTTKKAPKPVEQAVAKPTTSQKKPTTGTGAKKAATKKAATKKAATKKASELKAAPKKKVGAMQPSAKKQAGKSLAGKTVQKPTRKLSKAKTKARRPK
jgi:predicted enzyme related to lactoylglutathione lyase